MSNGSPTPYLISNGRGLRHAWIRNGGVRVERIRTTAESHRRIAIIEVMGRRARLVITAVSFDAHSSFRYCYRLMLTCHPDAGRVRSFMPAKQATDDWLQARTNGMLILRLSRSLIMSAALLGKRCGGGSIQVGQNRIALSDEQNIGRLLETALPLVRPIVRRIKRRAAP